MKSNFPAESSLKLQLVNVLFQEVTGKDPYLANQIKAAIDDSLDPEAPPHAQADQFFQSAGKLLAAFSAGDPRRAFRFWNAPSRCSDGFHPLLVRGELITLFQRLPPSAEATVVVNNLQCAIRPPGGRWSPRRRTEYAEAVRYIQDLAAASCPRSTTLLLVFV